MPRMRTLGEARSGGLQIVAVCSNVSCRAERELDLASVIGFVGDRHPLVPRLGAAHYSEKLVCPKCKTRGAFVWPKDLIEPQPQHAGLSWKINLWQGDVLIETVARTSSEVVANATFDSCVSHYKGQHLTMQQGMLVVRDSRVRLIAGRNVG